MHQVKLSLSKITTRHGNNTHSAITKEPQFDTRPSGPILVTFFDSGKRAKQKQRCSDPRRQAPSDIPSLASPSSRFTEARR